MIGIAWRVLALAVVLYNRVLAAELATKEQLLRLELKMIELADRKK